jgi:hypothetical protein
MNDFAPLRECLHRHAVPLLCLLGLAVAANVVALSGLFNTDPALFMSGLAQGFKVGLVSEPPGWLDPSNGFLSQPLGQLAMRDWLHGTVPWWNPYSGLGQPLAAQMEAPAFFFPFNIVMLLDNGWLWMRVILQALCGVFAYALFVELGLRRLAALLGGGLFALCPMFLLAPHASIAPMPFLPLLLLGIEQAAKGKRGFGLIAAALAYSILGAFPEVAVFDGTLAAAWSAYRFAGLPGAARWRFAGQVALGFALGVAVTAPLLVPFLEYVSHAELGPHVGGYFAHFNLPAPQRALQIIPFLFGEIARPQPGILTVPFGEGWVRLPGWVDWQVLALALAALWRPGKQAGLRWLLLGFVVFWELRDAGQPWVTGLVDLLPDLENTDCTRFTGPVLNFSVYALAALGLNDLLEQGALSWRRVAAVLASLVALLALTTVPVRGFIATWYQLDPGALRDALPSFVFGALMLGFVVWQMHRPRWSRTLTAALLAGPLLTLSLAQMGGARAGKLDPAPVAFLHSHLGLARLATTGPLGFNFNITYRIPAFTYVAMPGPRIDPLALKGQPYEGAFFGVWAFSSPDFAEQLLNRVPAYTALGVRYVAAPAQGTWWLEANMPLLAPGQHLTPQPLVLGAPLQITLTMIPPDGPHVLTGIYLHLATPGGKAHGHLLMKVAAHPQTMISAADYTSTGDDTEVYLPFPAPVVMDQGYQAIAFGFTQTTGVPGAILYGTGPQGLRAADITLQPPQTVKLPQVFNDGQVAIYEMPGTAPYAQASNPACQVTILDRQHMRTTCPAPARLTRLEMMYPGWQARVNGQAAAVTADGEFQSVALPAGAAAISFSYTPTHIRAACALALLAAAVWLGLVLIPRRRQKG